MDNGLLTGKNPFTPQMIAFLWASLVDYQLTYINKRLQSIPRWLISKTLSALTSNKFQKRGRGAQNRECSAAGPSTVSLISLHCWGELPMAESSRRLV